MLIPCHSVFLCAPLCLIAAYISSLECGRGLLELGSKLRRRVLKLQSFRRYSRMSIAVHTSFETVRLNFMRAVQASMSRKHPIPSVTRTMSRKRPIGGTKRTRTAPSLETPKKRKVVLLACGSFNPVTNMHLRMFELARDHLEDTASAGQYEVVKGILSPVGDGYKKKGLIEASHRVEMARLAAESSSWIGVDSWESRQADWLETVKVLRHHRQDLLSREPDTDVVGTAKAGRKRKRMDASSATKRRKLEDGPPQSSDEPQLMLLCGADVLDSFGVPGLWKPEDIEEILSHYGLVCVTRGSSDPEAVIQGSDLLWPRRHNIHVVREWVANDVSATHIRRALRRGQSVRYLLPDPVLSYIQERRLYTAESEQRNAGIVLAPLQKHAGNHD